jgi:hypothetical protein
VNARPFLAARRRPALLFVLPLTAVLGLSACGGSAKSNTAAATTTTVAGRASGGSAARAKFTSCLEAHGVPASQATRGSGFRGGGAGAGGSTPPTPPTTTAAYGAAFQACRSDLPTGPGRGGLQNTAAGRAYLQCLQLHGVTVPSTVPSTGSTATPGGGGAPGGGFASNPSFQAARTACAALAPTPGGGSGGSSTSSPTSAS